MSVFFRWNVIAHRANEGTHLELDHALERVHTDLAHVKHAVVEHADERKPVRPLLRALSEDEQTRIVLLRPELERRGVLERPDGIFLGEGDRIRPLQCHLQSTAVRKRTQGEV